VEKSVSSGRCRWSLCGVLDLTAAFVVYGFRGAGPIRILQSITAGLLGADSYDGGTTTAALGGILHFVIAFNVTAFYYVLSRKLELLIRQPVLAGILYGPAVYAFMNLIVLPLSAYPHRISNKVDLLLAGLIIHIFCVGLPIALVVSGYEKSRNALYKENFL